MFYDRLVDDNDRAWLHRCGPVSLSVTFLLLFGCHNDVILCSFYYLAVCSKQLPRNI